MNNKILIVLETDELGGAEIFAYEHSKIFTKKGLSVTILFLFGKPNYFYNINKNIDINLDYLNISHRWSVFEVFFKYILNKKYRNFDVIWSHLFFSIFYSRILKFFYKKVKHISFLHDTLYNRKIRFPFWIKITDYFYKVGFSLDDQIFATSEFCKIEYEKKFKINNIIQYYGHVNEELIYNAVDSFKKINYNNENCIKIIVPASIKEQKGHIKLLEALNKIEKSNFYSNITIKINFFGSIFDYSNQLLKYIKKNNIKTEINFNGPVSQENLFLEILKSDLVILPSTFEPLGAVILQSLALNKHVLISKNTGLYNEISNFFHLSFKNGDYLDLYKSINYFINNKNSLNSINQTKILKKFGMNNNVNTLIKYF